MSILPKFARHIPERVDIHSGTVSFSLASLYVYLLEIGMIHMIFFFNFFRLTLCYHYVQVLCRSIYK